MARPPWEWTEDDLRALITQAEDARREFKESHILSKDIEEIRKDLPKEASAFANTEGGVIVIGISERIGERGQGESTLPSASTMELTLLFFRLRG